MSGHDFSERLGALLDGELPPAVAAKLTAHLAICPDCARHLAELGALRAALAGTVPETAVSADLSARIVETLDIAATEPPRTVRFRPRIRAGSVLPFVAGLAVAAALMFAILPRHGVTGDLIAVRDAALRGTVTAVSGAPAPAPAPAVAGFRLVASRNDVIAGHRARVLIYDRRGQTVTLCIWKADGEPAHGVREARYRGMTIDYWNDGTDEFWAASAGPADGLRPFVRKVRKNRS